MNNARIWCVVKPTVGIPMLLGGVVVASLAVHTAVLTNVSWFSRFFEGVPMAESAALKTPDATASAMALIDPDGDGVTAHETKIQLPDGRVATVTVGHSDEPTTLASASKSLHN